MPERRFVQEFRDEFDGSKYPFLDTATLLASDTNQQLSTGAFVDASVHPIGAVSYVCVGSITVEAREVTITLADSEETEVATGTFDPLDPDPIIRCTDSYGRPAGVIVSTESQLRQFSSWEYGLHTFGADAATFVPSCVIPTPEVGVRGIRLDSGELFTMDVRILGENGVVVRQGDQTNQIRVDVIGDPLYRRKLCEAIDLFTTPRFIQTINGCPPDEHGHFHLVVGDHYNDETIMRIYASDTGLHIDAIGDTVRGA